MTRALRAALVAVFLLIPAAAAQAAPVVVSEFRFRGPDGGNDEFIELRNTSDTPRSIAGWTVRGCSSGGTRRHPRDDPGGRVAAVRRRATCCRTTARRGPLLRQRAGRPDLRDRDRRHRRHPPGRRRRRRSRTPSARAPIVGSAGVPRGRGHQQHPHATTATTATSASAARRTPTTTSRTSAARRPSDPQNAQGGDDAPRRSRAAARPTAPPTSPRTRRSTSRSPSP